MSGHVFATCGGGDRGWYSCADRFDADDFEVFDTIYRILTDTVRSVKVVEIRTWDCSGPEFLYKDIKDKEAERYGEEYHQKLCFGTEEEAKEFFKEFVFINREKVSRKQVLAKYRGIIDTILAGEMTPKNRRLLESHKAKFATLS